MKKLIVPVFIPHRGCPHRCVFCNQNSITGNTSAPSPDEVRRYLGHHLGPGTPHAVIAFYGGSFTNLPTGEQQGYLSVAGEFIGRGLACGIRLSTRPDCVDERVVSFLKANFVGTVELGVQSMDDGVLTASRRGHTAADSVKVAGHVKSAGLELGMQIMNGLPGDTRDKFMHTVEQVISLRPDFVRIYPALVVKGAPLEAVWKSGGYAPLRLDEAVEQCAGASVRFRKAGIRVVRMGLQPGRELEDALLAGPYHPAFGHLVESRLAYDRMSLALEGSSAGNVEFLVNPSELSVYKGIKSENVEKLGRFKKGLSLKITADAGVEKGGLLLKA